MMVWTSAKYIAAQQRKVGVFVLQVHRGQRQQVRVNEEEEEEERNTAAAAVVVAVGARAAFV